MFCYWKLNKSVLTLCQQRRERKTFQSLISSLTCRQILNSINFLMWCKSHDTKMKKIGKLIIYIICVIITIVIIDAGKSIEGASMLYYSGWFILLTTCVGIVKELSVKF